MIGGGEIHSDNILCALMILFFLKIPLNKSYILDNPKGRHECVGITHLNSKVFVDGAHAPDQIKRYLDKVINKQEKNCIIYGIAAHRQQSDRADILEEYAQKVIITDDTPMHEDPKKLRKQLLKLS